VGDARWDDAWTTALALAAGAGDRGALTMFIHATQSDVYRFLTYLGAGDEAENLTQETYLRALPALPSFTGRSSARIWLLVIARRVAADQLGQTSARPRTMVVEDWDVVVARNRAHFQSAWEDGVLLRELIAVLEADRRDAFVLTQVLGLGYAAAAEVCGCSVSTIRSRVARAREDLVHLMNGLGWPGRRSTGP
jgi:RNA polymerase sigma-70 factor, ECF subfamily